jgi:hypothetical protein
MSGEVVLLRQISSAPPGKAGRVVLYALEDGNIYAKIGTNTVQLATSAAGTAWGSISGTLSDQTDLNNAIAAKIAASLFAGGAAGQVLKKIDATDYNWSWSNDLTEGGGASVAWGAITGTLSNQSDLQTALNGKAASSHAHAISDVTNLQTTLDGKASTSHTHAEHFTVVKKTSNETRSTTTLSNDAALVLAVSANIRYSVRIRVFISGTGVNHDFKYRITGPASPTYVQIGFRGAFNGLGALATSAAAFDSSDRLIGANFNNGILEIDVALHNGSNSGTLAFQWARQAGTDVTVRAASTLEHTTS